MIKENNYLDKEEYFGLEAVSTENCEFTGE